jgi:regulator of sigma E protease
MSFFLTSTVSMLVVLGVMVLVHELGHFIVAKLCGVRVESFSIGFGRRLFGFRIGETEYKVCILPLGGYVKMSGENTVDPDSGKFSSRTAPVQADSSQPQAPDPGEFSSHPRWQRILIAFAGPVANFVLALGLMTGFYMMHNEVESYRSASAKIDYVLNNTPAANAGFQPGDLITQYDTVVNPTWEQVSIRSALNLGQTVNVTIDRAGRTIKTRMFLPSPRDSDDFDIESIGFIPQMQNDPISVLSVTAKMPAEKAGLKPGDQILSVDGIALHSPVAVLAFLQHEQGRPVQLTVLRDGKTFEIPVQPVMGDEGNGQKAYQIGFGTNPPPFQVQQLSFPAAFRQSIHFNARNSGLILEVLHRMVTRHLAVQNLTGPIGIARQTGLAVEQPGWQPLIGLMAIISLNLGIVNLMPIPIMDGGVIVLLMIEGIMRRDLNQEFKERIYQAAFVVLILFFAFIMFNDISKLPVFTKLRL